MRHVHHGCLAVISVLIIIAATPAPGVTAEDQTCKIRCQAPQLFIIVYDVYPDGDPAKLIWQGNLKNGQQIEIKTEFGRFFFRYKIDSEAQSDLINGVIRFCQNGETLNLP